MSAAAGRASASRAYGKRRRAAAVTGTGPGIGTDISAATNVQNDLGSCRDGLGVSTAVVRRPVGYTPRRGTGLTGYERVLVRAGLGPVVGIDEAGRGACAGPLVVAAVALDRWNGDSETVLADSKLLTARAREAAYTEIIKSALAWHVVVISSSEIDRRGLHVCNVAGMRCALAGLDVSPGYVLTDGFEVPGLAVPALAMWKGDQVSACVAAASIIAKVTRDRIMRALHTEYPAYGFARHKGYSTPSHMAALTECGPCPQHRRSFVNVACRERGEFAPELVPDPLALVMADGGRSLYLPPESEAAVVGAVPLDARRDGPIVESIAGSPAVGRAKSPDLADGGPGGSSEGMP
jgi:ribonuclease HII